MKKLLLALLFSALPFAAQAKETVTLIYSWGYGDSFATTFRTMVKEANAIQDRYNFQFEARPGAGGSIAANHVLNTSNTILISSSAFFIRPVVYPNESYDLNRYQILMRPFDCPMSVTTSKYSSWDQVPKNTRLTIGTSGLGVTTHLFALQLQQNLPNLDVVAFKATSESLVAAVGKQIDFHVAFLSEPESWSGDEKRKLNVLGITGVRRINSYEPLTNQGFSRTIGGMNVPYHLVVPNTMDENKYKEIREILMRANKSKDVIALYERDHCFDTSAIDTDMKSLYRQQREYWHKLASKVKL